MVLAVPAFRLSLSIMDSASSTDVSPTMHKVVPHAILASCSTTSSAPFLSAKELKGLNA